jgi:hypothetical protein
MPEETGICRMTADLTPVRIPMPFGPLRIAWPHIFQYRTRGGKLHDLPVGKEIPYTTEIHDAKAYRELFATGATEDPLHTGHPRPVPVDKRRTA